MVETNTATFNPDWASPPGDLIEEALRNAAGRGRSWPSGWGSAQSM